MNRPSLSGWTAFEIRSELRQLHRDLYGETRATDAALKRLGRAVVRLVMPDWSPGQRVPETVGRTLSYLLGDWTGEHGYAGRESRSTRRERITAMRDQLRREAA